MDASAPYFAEIADGPEGGRAEWARADDGVRIRIGVWPRAARAGGKGTVLIFPGRTEYVEKYGRAASDLAARGYASVAVDWRGQGLADRLLTDRSTGHVQHFGDYQRDVRTLVQYLDRAGIDGPYFLLAHSMGGAIGLEALYRHLPVRAAVFTAPMWGMAVSAWMRPIAWLLAWSGRKLRLGHLYAPGFGPETYVTSAAFKGNVLTGDAEMYDYLRRQLAAHPELSLGGPSLHWIHEALMECRRLRALPAPDVPAITMLGGNERVVDPAAVHFRMASWDKGRLQVVEGAEHELIMETPATRAALFDEADALFAAHA